MDKKYLVIIGGVVLVVVGGYLYYQNTITQAAQAKFQQKLAVYNGTTYFFYNGLAYALTPEQAGMFGIIKNPNLLLLTIKADEFSRFKSGGAFNWVGFPFDKVGVWSSDDTSGKLYYAQNGTKRWVTDGNTWTSILGSPTLNIVAGELNLPLALLNSLPTGSNIDKITDIVQGFVKDTSGGEFLITGNSIQEFSSPASLNEWLSKNGNTSPIIISDSTVHDIPWNNTLA
jgi:hypothetical protein